MDQTNLKPFIKWVGGKKDVIKKHLYQYLPKEFNCYYEPFLGGAAMLAYLKPKKAVVNDINQELIATYQVIKKNLDKLIIQLKSLEKLHCESFYYKTRAEHNNKSIKLAARFIYLNKTGFNGLYRVNKKGLFNVPFNKKATIKLFKEPNLVEWSNYLNNYDIQFLNKDFKTFFKTVNLKENDFVFVDPPYDYEVGSNSFTSYTKSGFNQFNQKELANYLKLLDQKGIKWMLTNHNTKLINELYQDYKIIPIQTNRNINCKSDLRKNNGNEVVIINY